MDTPSKQDIRARADALKAAADGPALRTALAGLDLDRLDSGVWDLLARGLRGGEETAQVPDIRLAVLSNFTLDLLPRFLSVRAAAEGVRTAGYVGPFDQHVQEVLNPESGLHRFRPDAVFLALSLHRLRPERFDAFATLIADDRRTLREEIADHLESWATAALERLSATLLIANFPSPPRPLAGVADVKAGYGETEFFLELNLDLLRRFKGNPRLRLVDADALTARFGKEQVLDRKLHYLAKMDWSPAFLPVVAGELVRQLRAIRGQSKKCLVLDLDNTLWGGVVGEEGPAGVRIGPGEPEGEAFLDFHRRLLALRAQGVLLAVCSKNNPADVAEVFETRPEIPLRPTDFAATEICWDPKHEGLRKIAKALNIGTDSLVFLDDNPVEIELIRQMLPEVEAVQMPADPAEYPAVLDRLTFFERAIVLEDDLKKAEQYQQNRERDELRSTTGDLGDFLKSLGTELEIRRARPDDLPRVHQLFTKTNQFNVTTIRYTQADIERFAASSDHELWVARARDRFGDLGTISAMLLAKEGSALVIDSFLMSCRAMGRGIETALTNHLKSRVEANVAHELQARYLPTAKNKPVENLYEEQGFRLVETGEGGEKKYVLGKGEAVLRDCGWINLTPDPSPIAPPSPGRGAPPPALTPVASSSERVGVPPLPVGGGAMGEGARG
ncbi:MAG TPA: HAD-IIIC family phosphatase [Thermoanaerobaculia bacterium]|nr:HAD-IIIC family phosphatase [Thermoanaerobaculia bacterium]